jgi:hypothetical protein
MQCGVLAAFYLGALPAAAQDSTAVELSIEMNDLARVPPAVMRETKAEVEQTFLTSGVRIVWVAPDAPSRDHTPLKLYVVGPSSLSPRADEGPHAAIIGLAPESGDWAQVFYGRVAAAVAPRSVPISVVLAHVIAHEIGHLLLRPNSHAPFGVMRRAVELDHPTLRRFTGEQGRLIRTALSTGRRYAWPCAQ